MNTIKLSIIIPVYNVEKYIRQCMISCLEQEGVCLGEDYEIIIVNDGTPDKSMDIAKQLTDSHKGVTITNQSNQGLSVARNNGLSLAKGTYVWFIDSDDWIEKDSVLTVLSKTSGQTLDIIKIRAYRTNFDDKITLRHKNYKEHKIMEGPEAWSADTSNTPIQFNIIKKELLDNYQLKFLPNVYHEDNEFTPRVFWFASKVGFINKPLYYHRANRNSITSTPNPKRAFDLIEVCKSLHEFSQKREVLNNRKYSIQLNRFISMTLNNGLNIIEKTKKKEIVLNLNLKLSENRQLINHLIKSRSPKYIMEGILFKLYNNYVKTFHYMNIFKI